jgi:hypothetical protein
MEVFLLMLHRIIMRWFKQPSQSSPQSAMQNLLSAGVLSWRSVVVDTRTPAIVPDPEFTPFDIDALPSKLTRPAVEDIGLHVLFSRK